MCSSRTGILVNVKECSLLTPLSNCCLLLAVISKKFRPYIIFFFFFTSKDKKSFYRDHMEKVTSTFTVHLDG